MMQKEDMKQRVKLIVEKCLAFYQKAKTASKQFIVEKCLAFYQKAKTASKQFIEKCLALYQEAKKEPKHFIVEKCLVLYQKAKIASKQFIEKCLALYQEAKKEPKQLIVGAVILLCAILLLVFAFTEKQGEPQPELKQVPVIEQEISKAHEPEVIVAEKEIARINIMPEDKEPKTQKTKVVAEPKLPVKPIKVEPKNAVLTFTATTEKDIDFQVFYTVKREVWFDGSLIVDHKGKKGTHKYSIVLPVKEVFRIRLDFSAGAGAITIKDIYLTGSQKADLNNFSMYELHHIEKAVVNKDGSFSFNAIDRDPFMSYRPALLPE